MQVHIQNDGPVTIEIESPIKEATGPTNIAIVHPNKKKQSISNDSRIADASSGTIIDETTN